eukprot:7583027-Pyramimonas_sp.AAC.1
MNKLDEDLGHVFHEKLVGSDARGNLLGSTDGDLPHIRISTSITRQSLELRRRKKVFQTTNPERPKRVREVPGKLEDW